jgi:6-pyruvoyltetrahydropterin/6-carboxytetrahydropterin synthase
VLVAIVPALSDALPVRLSRVLWRVTPYYGVGMSATDRTTVSIRQRFDFAAAHRLHVDALSDERNRELFGKCNNPSGHGHNYQIEPEVEVDLDERGVPSLGLADLERLTDELVVQRFDHKHLNLDTSEFGPGGLNPSVENIARVSFELLAGPIGRAGARLRRVTVWETDRTRATYPADGSG